MDQQIMALSCTIFHPLIFEFVEKILRPWNQG